MGDRVPTYIYANDPISQAGVTAQLRMRPEIRIVEGADVDSAEVAVIVTAVVDDETLRVLRGLQRGTSPRSVLIVDTIDDAALARAV